CTPWMRVTASPRLYVKSEQRLERLLKGIRSHRRTVQNTQVSLAMMPLKSASFSQRSSCPTLIPHLTPTTTYLTSTLEELMDLTVVLEDLCATLTLLP